MRNSTVYAVLHSEQLDLETGQWHPIARYWSFEDDELRSFCIEHRPALQPVDRRDIPAGVHISECVGLAQVAPSLIRLIPGGVRVAY